ncbi:MAG: murein L,D-transpeptidase, partial [Actinobacteria bacterium]|nr:murein L,D-transpeptidase [Actinomycetota bacterium]
TPEGTFAIDRERPDGWWNGDLGKIYRPKYFNGGVAIHGSTSVPAYPASHGCVRVSVAAMDMIWDKNLLPRGTTVVVHSGSLT